MTDVSNDRFRIGSDGAVARITLCQPDEGNTLAPPDMVAFGKSVLREGSRPDVKVVLVNADGADFCLGRRHVANVPKPANARAFRARVADAILGVYADIHATPVPVLTAVQGRSFGFGCAFTVASDITIAERSATFALPEMDTNLPPTLAISACLPKMPRKAILNMVLTREPVDAQTAFYHGMVSQIVADGSLSASADDYLAKLVDRDRDALIAIKEYMQLAPGMSADAAARYGANLIATEMTSQDRD